MNNKKLRIALFIAISLALVLFTVMYIRNSASSRVSSELLIEIKQVKNSDIIFGDVEASLSIILYADYNCKFCKKFFKEVFPKLKTEYIDSEKLNLNLRLVCGELDKRAMEAYQTATCINNFGRYESLHKLFLHKSEIIYTVHFQELMDEYIQTNDDVAECILNSDYQNIKGNIYQFQELKTKGTPTFVIGTEIVKGYKNYDTFKRIIESNFNLYTNN